MAPPAGSSLGSETPGSDDAVMVGGNAIVDRFVSTLSPWQLLHLRNRMRSIDIDTSEIASFEDLPYDAIHRIANYLSLRDIITCRLVSRQWKDLFMSDAIVRRYCREIFPGLVELHPEDAQSDPERLLMATLAKHVPAYKRLHGKYVAPWKVALPKQLVSNDGCTETVIGRDAASMKPFGTGLFPRLYAEGKVAWQLDRNSVFIDDLRTGVRLRCALNSDPRRPPSNSRLVAVSSELVVLLDLAAGFRSLFIFHIHTRHWNRVSLPAVLAHCACQRDMVVACCWGGQVTIWRWKKTTTEITVSGHDQIQPVQGTQFPTNNEYGGVPAVLFHPQRNDIMFLTWILWMSGGEESPIDHVAAVVTKYQYREESNAFESVKTSSRVRPARLPQENEMLVITPNLSKMNSHGLYHVLSMYKRMNPQPRPGYGKPEEVSSMCFSTTSEAFLEPLPKFQIYLGSGEARNQHDPISEPFEVNVNPWSRHYYKLWNMQHFYVWKTNSKDEPRVLSRSIYMDGEVGKAAAAEEEEAEPGQEVLRLASNERMTYDEYSLEVDDDFVVSLSNNGYEFAYNDDGRAKWDMSPRACSPGDNDWQGQALSTEDDVFYDILVGPMG